MILITGATGNNGIEVIRLLSERGAALRGMSRNPPDRAHASGGVEFVRGDFDDPVSIRRALDDVDQVFLVTNSSERVEEQQLSFHSRLSVGARGRVLSLSLVWRMVF
jgi:uncharacterized protein YbjT (DUF2867 family)